MDDQKKDQSNQEYISFDRGEMSITNTSNNDQGVYEEVVMEDVVIENDGGDSVYYIVQPQAGDTAVGYDVIEDGTQTYTIDVGDGVHTTYGHVITPADHLVPGAGHVITTTGHVIATPSHVKASSDHVTEYGDHATEIMELTIQPEISQTTQSEGDEVETVVDVKEETEDCSETNNKEDSVQAYEDVTYLLCCQYCGESVQTLAELRGHLQDIHDIGDDVNTVEDDEIEVREGAENDQNNQQDLLCISCFKTFPNDSELGRHSCIKNENSITPPDSIEHTEKKAKQKVVVNKVGKNKILIKLDTVSSGTNFHNCQVCHKSFSERTDLETHIEENNCTANQHAYCKCPYCPLLYKQENHRKTIAYHIKMHHPGMSFDPNTDCIVINNTAGYKTSVREQQKVEEIACTQCDEIFRYKRDYIHHIQKYHPEHFTEDMSATLSDTVIGTPRTRISKKVARECNMAFIECQFCDKKFIWAKSVKRHILEYHEAELPDDYDINEHLGIGTRRRRKTKGNNVEGVSGTDETTIKTRKEKELTEKQMNRLYKCPFCTLVSKYANSIRLHMSRFHKRDCKGINLNKIKLATVDAKSGNYQVKVMDKTPMVEKLKDSAVVFKCPLCSYASRNQSNLLRHMTSKKHNHSFSMNELKKGKLKHFKIKFDGKKLSDTETEMTKESDEDETLESITDVKNKNVKQTKEKIDKADGTSYKLAIDDVENVKEKQNLNVNDNDKGIVTAEIQSRFVDCIACKMKFFDYSKLIDHLKTHVNVKVTFKCVHCDCSQFFSHFSKLEHHHKVAHRAVKDTPSKLNCVAMETIDCDHDLRRLKSYECPYCELILSKVDVLGKHVLLNHHDIVQNLIVKQEKVDDGNEMNADNITSTREIVNRQPSTSRNSKQVLQGFSTQFKCLFCECVFQNNVTDIIQHTQIVHPNVDKTDIAEEVTGRHSEIRLRKRSRKYDSDVEDEFDNNHSKPKSAKKDKSWNAKTITNAKTNLEKKQKNKVRKDETLKHKAAPVADCDIRSQTVDGNKCPHCPFTCRRASALVFHINLSHAKIKQEPVEDDSQYGHISSHTKKNINQEDDQKQMKEIFVQKCENSANEAKSLVYDDQTVAQETNKKKNDKLSSKKGHVNKSNTPVEPNTPVGNKKLAKQSENVDENICEGEIGTELDLSNVTLSEEIQMHGTRAKTRNMISHLIKQSPEKVNTDNDKDKTKTTKTSKRSIDLTTDGNTKKQSPGVILKQISKDSINDITSKIDQSLEAIGNKMAKSSGKYGLKTKRKPSQNDTPACIELDDEEIDKLAEELEMDDDNDKDYSPTEEDADNNTVKLGSKTYTLPNATKYKCLYCDVREFTKVRFLEKHVKKTHPDKWDTFNVIEAEIAASATTMIKVENDRSSGRSMLPTCSYCKQSFTSELKVKRHVQEVHTKLPKNIVKAVVPKIVRVKTEDVLSNTDNSVIESITYDYESDDKESFSTHVQDMHQNTPEVHGRASRKQSGSYNCPYCNLISSWKKCIVRHVQDMHPHEPKVTYNDVIEKQKTHSKKQRSGKTQSKTDETGVFSCPYCGVINKWKKSVIRHIRTVHPELNSNVELTSIIEDNDILNLNKMDARVAKKQCALCGFLGRHTRKMNEHFARHHPTEAVQFQYVYDAAATEMRPKDHVCPICGLAYNWKKSLLYHVKHHHAEKSEVFQLLDKMLDIVDKNTEPPVLKSKLLTPRKSFKPTNRKQPCVAPSIKSKLGNSVLTHRKCTLITKLRTKYRHYGNSKTGVKCRLCEGLYKSVIERRVHEVIRHRGKHHTCVAPNCNRRFWLRSSLMRHYNLVHEGDSSANTEDDSWMSKCEVCGVTFSTPTRLTEHIKSTHTILDENFNTRVTHRARRNYACPVCRKPFDSINARDDHMTLEHTEMTLVCDTCGTRFATIGRLAKHKLSHKNEESEGQRMCEWCGISIKGTSLNKHYLFKHTAKLVCDCPVCSAEENRMEEIRGSKYEECTICQKLFCKKLFLQAHTRLHHNNINIIRCTKCQEVFPNKGTRAVHMHKSHQTAPNYKCDACDSSFFSDKQLKEHVMCCHANHGPDPEHATDHSDQVGSQLSNHLTRQDQNDDKTTHIIHVGEDQGLQYLPRLSEASFSAVMKEIQIIDEKNPQRPFKCLLCGRNFAKVKYIRIHIRRNHVRDEDQPYRCKVCGAGFVRLTEFRKHSRSHSGFRPYKCTVCFKAFKQQANLKDHMNIHKATKDYQCLICNRFFQQRGSLNAHVVCHDTIKPFKCNFCNKGYTSRGELSRHMLKYKNAERDENLREFLCHICQKAFTHFPLLLKHIEEHNPQKPFQCLLCNNKYSSFVSMYYHKSKEGHWLMDEIAGADEPLNNAWGKATQNKTNADHETTVGKGVPAATDAYNLQEALELVNQAEMEMEKDGQVVNEDNNVENDLGIIAGSENEELLSIAKQLTELSSFPHKLKSASGNPRLRRRTNKAASNVLRAEDQYIRDMLDADSELLLNIDKHLRDEQEINLGEIVEQDAVQYIMDGGKANTIEVNENELTHDQNVLETVFSDTLGNGEIIPSNLTELASLISQSNEKPSKDNITAYQSMDGSVIYVCMNPKPENETSLNEIKQDEEIPEEVVPTIDMKIDDEIGDHIEVTYEEVVDEHADQIAETEIIDSQGAGENSYNTTDNNTNIETSILETNVKEGILQYENIEVLVTSDDVNTETKPEIDIDVASTDEKVIQASVPLNVGTFVKDKDETEQAAQNIAASEDYNSYQYEYHVQQPQEEVVSTDTHNDDIVNTADQKIEIVVQDAAEMGTDSQNVIVVASGEVNECVVQDITELEAYEEEMDDVVEYENDEKTFIKEELLETSSITSVEAGSLTLEGQKFKYIYSIDDRLFICLQCGQRVKSFKTLKNHLSRHLPSELRPHSCPTCGDNKRFVTVSELKKHQLTHTNERLYRCEYCSKAFIQRGHLQTHELIHKGVKPFECLECDSKFRTSSLLKTHQKRQHSGPDKETFPCPDCNMMFTNATSLKVHVGHKHSAVFDTLKTTKATVGTTKTTVPRKDITCQICTVCGFSINKIGMAAHMKTHGVEESPSDQPEESDQHNFVCDLCGAGLKTKKGLASHHYRYHSDEKSNICEYCGESFKHKWQINSHIWSLHKDEFEQRNGQAMGYECKFCKQVFRKKRSLAYHAGSSQSCRDGILTVTKHETLE